MMHGCFAVDAFDGVDDIEGLEYGRSIYLAAPNSLKIAELILSSRKSKKIVSKVYSLNYL